MPPVARHHHPPVGAAAAPAAGWRFIADAARQRAQRDAADRACTSNGRSEARPSSAHPRRRAPRAAFPANLQLVDHEHAVVELRVEPPVFQPHRPGRPRASRSALAAHRPAGGVGSAGVPPIVAWIEPLPANCTLSPISGPDPRSGPAALASTTHRATGDPAPAHRPPGSKRGRCSASTARRRLLPERAAAHVDVAGHAVVETTFSAAPTSLTPIGFSAPVDPAVDDRPRCARSRRCR